MWWAPRPWIGRLGTYQCVCLVRERLFVGVTTQEAFFWVEAAEALQPNEAKAWTGLRGQPSTTQAVTRSRVESSSRFAGTRPSVASVKTRRSR